MPLTVAVVGRPNVGKSTLFNRLVGKKLAIVDDTPGVTRDRREGDASIADLSFRVFDTAGLEEAFDESLEARMRTQTAEALEDADVALMLFDARAGLTPLDEHFAKWLRALDMPVILAANKCEGKNVENGIYEAYGLGLGDPLPISAEHGQGMGELYDALRPYADAAEQADAAARLDDKDEDDENKPLQLAIVGRPNVGKSTLVNRLIGKERMLTGPEAGITRDSIAVDCLLGRQRGEADRYGRPSAQIQSHRQGRKPVRRRYLARHSLCAGGRALARFKRYARKAGSDYRQTGYRRRAGADYRRQQMGCGQGSLGSAYEASRPVADLPAASTRHPYRDFFRQNRKKASTDWRQRCLRPMTFGTAAFLQVTLNQWLIDVIEGHPPPMARGRRLKIRYITQAKTRPPTFVMFVSQPKEMPDSYLRYLQNALREDFNMPGVPVRLTMRGGQKPLRQKGLIRGQLILGLLRESPFFPKAAILPELSGRQGFQNHHSPFEKLSEEEIRRHFRCGSVLTAYTAHTLGCRSGHCEQFRSGCFGQAKRF